MTPQEIRRYVKLLLYRGIHFVPRTASHTPEARSDLEQLLNRVLARVGRSATVTLDRLGMMVVLDELPDDEC